MNTIAPRDSRQYHGENQHPGKLPHPEVGCPLALDADDGAKPHALARDVRRVASIDLRVRAQASRVRPLGRPYAVRGLPCAAYGSVWGARLGGGAGQGVATRADILVALRCPPRRSASCTHRTRRVSTVRAPHHPNLSRACGARGKVGEGRQWLQGLALAGNACSNAVLGDLRTRGSQRRSRATRPGQHSQPKRYPTRLSARRQIHHPSARPICAPERSADPARPSSAHLVQHGPGVQLAHRACPAHRPPLRRPRVSARAPECGPAAAPRRAGGRVAGPSGGRACRAVASGSERLLHRALRPCSTHPHTRASAAPARPRARPRRAGARAAATGEDVGAGSHGAAYEDGLPHRPVRLGELGVPPGRTRASRPCGARARGAARRRPRVPPPWRCCATRRTPAASLRRKAPVPPSHRRAAAPPRGARARRRGAAGGRTEGRGRSARRCGQRCRARLDHERAVHKRKVRRLERERGQPPPGKVVPGLAHAMCRGRQAQAVGGRGGQRAWRRDSAGPSGDSTRAQASCASTSTRPSAAMARDTSSSASVHTWCPSPREPECSITHTVPLASPIAAAPASSNTSSTTCEKHLMY